MKRFARILTALAILAGGMALSILLWITRPIAEKKPFVEVIPPVEVQRVEFRSFTFDIPSQGIIEASRRADLAAAVAGKVIEVNPQFDTGNRITKGTWLVRVDPTDFEANRAMAAANLANAGAALASEEAKAAQAAADWRKLGNGGDPPDLTLRGPQLRSAKAQMESATAALRKAETDLERTEIEVPFDCVISSKRTEVGNYLTPGAPVATIFESAPFEIRLPVSFDQLQFIDLDENGNPTGEVEIIATAGGTTKRFPARLVRSEGEIDRESRSVYLVAEVDAGEGGAGGLQPGLFVKASIRGRNIPDRARIPFTAFVDLERVAIVAPDETLQFREVTVVFRDKDSVYISDGLKDNDLICLTELPSMIQGLKVSPSFKTAGSSPSDKHAPETAP